MFEAFSIHANFKTLVDMNVSSGDISSLHGIRFLNALALLLSHKHAALLFTPYMNRTSMAKVTGTFYSSKLLFKKCLKIKHLYSFK